ncbi:MAG: putative toxin-antitoxin system toxin component, PIN family [Cyclobacterium sp.]|uniref:putative toxin-antitoxin system toxin component, PIN family n=1 Tax=Cyclobacterium sp. TaxID=1966343 RepID=UPI0039709AA9
MSIHTNELIGAHLLNNSLSANVLDKALRSGKVFFSDATFTEFAEVLYRKKLDKYFSYGEREEILAALTFNSTRYSPDIQIKASRDPKDDKFLELAVSAKAACLISGEK